MLWYTDFSPLLLSPWFFLVGYLFVCLVLTKRSFFLLKIHGQMAWMGVLVISEDSAPLKFQKNKLYTETKMTRWV